MPNSIVVIGEEARHYCRSVQELLISSNLKFIDTEALSNCTGLNTICFPSTLETSGAISCDRWAYLKSPYCAAPIPPTCLKSEQNPDAAPFGRYGDDYEGRNPEDIPVYVPVGSADLYRNAWGWSYFTNFIETGNFPIAGIHDVIISEKEQDDSTYDLLDRKVEKLEPRKSKYAMVRNS